MITSQLNPKMYLEDYIKFGVYGRLTAVKALRRQWRSVTAKHQLLLFGNLLQEYGHGIEELFAITYALYKQCNATVSPNGEEEEVFFDTLLHYRHRDLWKFIQAHDFRSELKSLLRLPSDDQVAKCLDLEVETYRQAITCAGHTLEDRKVDFFEREFKEIFNKLKHPFIVLSPIHQPNALKLPQDHLWVLSSGAGSAINLKARPIQATEKVAAEFEGTIKQVTHDIVTLVKVVLCKYKVQYE